MDARDDSVLRGSLIAALIFLVISAIIIFLLWRWGDTQAREAQAAQTRLIATQTELRKQADQARLMKTMLGLGALTQAEFDELNNGASGDPDMDAITASFVRDMALFGPDVSFQNRNYPALPAFLMNAIRDRAAQYAAAREAQEKTRSKAENDAPSAPAEQKPDLPE